MTQEVCSILFLPFLMLPNSTPTALESQQELDKTLFIHALIRLADAWNARLKIEPFHMLHHGINDAK